LDKNTGTTTDSGDKKAQTENKSAPKQSTTQNTPGTQTTPTPPRLNPTVESVYKNKASIDISRGKYTKPDEEYIVITADSKNKEPIPLTGWTIKSQTGFDTKIGKGAYLTYERQIGAQENIFLKPKEKAYVITGRSPISTSFRLNKCMGYFEQFKDFNPSIPTDCPSAYTYKEPLAFIPTDACLDFLERLPRCTTQIKIPESLQVECKDIVTKRTNYDYCVNTYKNDSDFYQPEWRIYLNRDDEIWKQKRETISLFDEKGELIAQKSY